MQPDDLWRKYPTVFHMAAVAIWPTVQQLGLLSTSALLDLFGVTGDERDSLTTHRRADSVRLHHPEHGEGYP